MQSREESGGRALVEPPDNNPRATEATITYPVAPTTTRILACFVAFIVPGAGHMVLGRITRGLIFLACVTAMFSLGLLMEGRLFTLTTSTDWLSKLFSIFDAGIGLIYLFCWAGDWFTQGTPLARTFEYGNTFLMVAGLLNYLIVLDVWDIAVGRKS